MFTGVFSDTSADLAIKNKRLNPKDGRRNFAPVIFYAIYYFAAQTNGLSKF
jgi:hypothetical protein